MKMNEMRAVMRRNRGEKENGGEEEMSGEGQSHQESRLPNKRKTKRRTQRANINYADDFEYDDCDEEDYNAGEDFL